MVELTPLRRRKGRGITDPFFNFFDDFIGLPEGGFRTDIKETETEHIIQAELPGVKRENINIEINDNYLTISAANDEVNEEKRENYLRRERRSGTFRRSFSINNVNEEQIEAKYEDGILEVRLPKKTPGRKNRTIDIH